MDLTPHDQWLGFDDWAADLFTRFYAVAVRLKARAVRLRARAPVAMVLRMVRCIITTPVTTMCCVPPTGASAFAIDLRKLHANRVNASIMRGSIAKRIPGVRFFDTFPQSN